MGTSVDMVSSSELLWVSSSILVGNVTGFLSSRIPNLNLSLLHASLNGKPATPARVHSVRECSGVNRSEFGYVVQFHRADID